MKKLKYLLILSLLISGCTDVPGKLLVMQANYYYSKDRQTEAVSSYLNALEYGEAAPYAEYGLGTVYYSLGEEQAALNRFSKAIRLLEITPAASNRELRYRIQYNTGVVLFSRGDFAGAASFFREALRIDGSKVEAKRNLELSVLSQKRETAFETDNRGGDENTGDANSENHVILMEFIRQKELNQWRSREWPEEDTVGPDY